MNTLAGTGKLVRLILRRDRFLLPLWLVLLPLILLSFVSSFNALFPTALERQQYADVSAGNAGFITLYGLVYGSGVGELVAWRAGFYPIIVGLISLLMVIRHTRTDEEAGRRELLGSTVVGRHAPLAAALVATCGANLVLALLVGLGMTSQGLSAAGSFAFGLQLAAAGWIFAGVGAGAAQLTESAGGARGIAVSVLGAAYLLRVVGDLSEQSGGGLSWLSWISPIGLVHRIYPYADDRWWVVAPAIAATVLLALVAVALNARRDVGAGLLPTRLGPATASPRLRSPLALAWRLHRGLLLGWSIGFALMGFVLGGAANSVGDLVAENPNLREVFARAGGQAGLIDAFLAAVMGILGLIAAAYAIQATLRLRYEETNTRAEPVLATAVSRLRWAGSHLVFSILGSTVALAVAGLATGLAHGLNAGDVGREVPRVVGAAMLQMPAVWILAGVAVALFGLLPRLTPAAWGVYAACFLIGLVGSAVQLSQWVMDLSPFTHVPRAFGAAVSAIPVVWLLAIALALVGAGLVGLRRRDVPVT